MQLPKPYINSLWIGGRLGPMGHLTLHSFIRQGYSFRLWVYEKPNDLPALPALEIRDAREILPETAVFRYERSSYLGHGKNSVAGFSDLFRYELLARHGGWWSDMDVTCLAALPHTSDYCFRSHHKLPAVGNLMHCPPDSPLMRACADEARQKVQRGNRDWMLPIKILNHQISRLGLQQHIREMTNPDSWWTIRKLLGAGPYSLAPHWVALHWNNTDWQRLGLSPTQGLPGSVYTRLMQEHGIALEPLPERARRQLQFRLGLPWFAWRSLRNRLDFAEGHMPAIDR